MNILIIGSGGREHALAWKAAQSAQVEKVYVAPGNAGTASENKTLNIPISSTDLPHLLEFAKKNAIDLTIVGPEAPLALGIVDLFKKEKLRCFGPTKTAAQLESSKHFSKLFMRRFKIPTAKYAAFTDIDEAVEYIKNLEYERIVIKADGLAAGKGVVIARNKQEAITAAEDILIGNMFGHAGDCIIVEEFLEGEEASFIAIIDGDHILPLASSQDHKTRDNGDRGPNTGGMGAYSPAHNIDANVQERILKEIMFPTLNGMKKMGNPYVGFLYAGIMIAKDGTLNLLEYNCRLGDPETQPIMMRLKSDLVELCMSAMEKKLDQVELEWDTRPALGVVLTAGGYPDQYRKGDTIYGLSNETNSNCKIFHAGTAIRNGQVVTSGGRVLCVTALGETIGEAQKRAYKIAAPIEWENIYYRTDIGHRALKARD
ncbi:MAG: phosphoribosylamine--glycine ligase [Gammaproteobacteria bacterium]|nr:phosphoribosylamine--glycine ligase [Gammaproteobacteria bacterium]